MIFFKLNEYHGIHGASSEIRVNMAHISEYRRLMEVEPSRTGSSIRFDKRRHTINVKETPEQIDEMLRLIGAI